MRVGKLYGYIDRHGQMVIEPRFEEAGDIRDGDLGAVKEGGAWGFVNQAGEFVLEAVYEFAAPFHEGLALVVRDAKFGYIDETGREVIPPQFDGGLDFCEGMANIAVGDRRGFIDRQGRIVVEPVYVKAAQCFHEGLAWVRKEWGEGVGFIDIEGHAVLDPMFYDDWGEGFFEGLAAMQDHNEKVGFIDKTGRWVIAPIYDHASRFSEGLAFVMKGEETAFIDQTGVVVVDLTGRSTSAYDFHDGLAAANLAPSPSLSRNQEVELPQTWGYIDKTGAFAIEPQFSLAGDFVDGLAHVWLQDGREAVINTQGEIIWRAP